MKTREELNSKVKISLQVKLRYVFYILHFKLTLCLL